MNEDTLNRGQDASCFFARVVPQTGICGCMARFVLEKTGGRPWLVVIEMVSMTGIRPYEIRLHRVAHGVRNLALDHQGRLRIWRRRRRQGMKMASITTRRESLLLPATRSTKVIGTWVYVASFWIARQVVSI